MCVLIVFRLVVFMCVSLCVSLLCVRVAFRVVLSPFVVFQCGLTWFVVCVSVCCSQCSCVGCLPLCCFCVLRLCVCVRSLFVLLAVAACCVIGCVCDCCRFMLLSCCGRGSCVCGAVKRVCCVCPHVCVVCSVRSHVVELCVPVVVPVCCYRLCFCFGGVCPVVSVPVLCVLLVCVVSPLWLFCGCWLLICVPCVVCVRCPLYDSALLVWFGVWFVVWCVFLVLCVVERLCLLHFL